LTSLEEEIRQFKKMFHQMYRLHRWMIFFSYEEWLEYRHRVDKYDWKYANQRERTITYTTTMRLINFTLTTVQAVLIKFQEAEIRWRAI